MPDIDLIRYRRAQKLAQKALEPDRRAANRRNKNRKLAANQRARRVNNTTFVFQATRRFWKDYAELDIGRKNGTRYAMRFLLIDPWRYPGKLRLHSLGPKFEKKYGQPVYSAKAGNDNRVLFIKTDNVITFLTVGKHDYVYRL